MKKLITLFILFGLIHLFGHAQEFPMADQTLPYQTCSGVFTDSQGTAANYLPDETITTTICSPFATDRLQVAFTQFDLAPGDILTVFDGEDANAPFLGAFGSFLAPTTFIASDTSINPTGCLTFVFNSNAVSQTAPGWQANISCINTCQTITSSVTTVPAPDADGILRICQGDTVTVTGTPTFGSDGTGSTEEIRLPNGTVVAGNTASETFPDPGVFTFDYIVTDNTGCRDRTLEDVLILVSTDPDFTGTEAESDIVCFGDTVEITGVVESTQFTAEVAPPIAGETFLPDICGGLPAPGVYRTCIDVQGFAPGQSFSDVSNLVSIFLNMEHSYLGDLDIFLEAPNGQEVQLFDRLGSGATFLGEPVDPDAPCGTPQTAGVGFDYRFTFQGNATQTWTQAAGGFGSTIAAGDYFPEEDFSAFLGSDLNGPWCLRIEDWLPSDNGFIFEWGLEFDPAIIPNVDSYTPGEVTEIFSSNPDIINTVINRDANDDIIDTVITVQPDVIGQNCYDFVFTDDFGCSYTETVCVEMVEEIVTATPGDIEVCASLGNTNVNLNSQGTIALDNLPFLDYRLRYYTNLSDAEAGATNNITNTSAYPVTEDTDIFIRVENARSGCFEIETFNIDFSDVVANPVGELTECDAFPFDDSDSFDLTQEEPTLLGNLDPNTVDVLYYTSATAAQSGLPGTEISNPTSYESASGQIFVRVQDSANTGCFDTTSFNIVVTTVAPTTAVADVEECDSFPFDLTTDFDLSVNNDLVLNGRDETNFTIQYFPTRQDALDNTNEVSANYEGADMEEIFVLLTENTTGCAEVYNFTLTTLGAPPVGTAPDLSECDEAPFDLRLEFDLSLQDDAIRGGLSPTDYSVGYYTSESNAFNDIDQLPSINEAADGEIIYARLTDLDTGCSNVSSFNITVEQCEVIFPEGFTPNNDGTNDTFEIPNIEQYPNFSLKVFNRYGTLVYETSASNYVEFDGVPNSGLNSGDGLLPVGTYFYTMEFKDGETQDIASWLYINY